MGKVLVTGAAGAVGIQICAGLLDKGYHVLGIDRKSNPYNEGKPEYEFIALTPNEKEKFSKVFENNVIDCVIHAACVADNDIGPNITDIEVSESKVWDSFLYKMANLVQVNQCILISTTQVYKTPETREPVREDDDLMPVTNYAKLKAEAEDALAFEFKKSKSTAVCAVRCPQFYLKDMPDNFRAKVTDPKDGTNFMYRKGDYGFHFCNIFNLVDFILSYIRSTEKIKPEERYQHTGYYNCADKDIISAADIVNFLSEYHTIGIVQQKKESDIKSGALSKLLGGGKAKGEALSNYRYLDMKTILGNHRYDVNKASRICPLKWTIQNTK